MSAEKELNNLRELADFQKQKGGAPMREPNMEELPVPNRGGNVPKQTSAPSRGPKKNASVDLRIWDYWTSLAVGVFIVGVGSALLWLGLMGFEGTVTDWGISSGTVHNFFWLIVAIYLCISAAEFRLAPDKILSFQSIQSYFRQEKELATFWMLIVVIDLYGVFGGVKHYLVGKNILGYTFGTNGIFENIVILIAGLIVAFGIAFGAEPVIKKGLQFFIKTLKNGI